MLKTWIFLIALTPNAFAGEWKQLFNGKDLTGWEHVGPGSFTVENGAMETHGGMGLLYWKGGKIGNSVIRVVFRGGHKADNSGVYIRIPLEPVEPWMPCYYGSEIQIENEPERWGPDDHYYTGSIYSQTLPLARPPMKPPGEWNVMEITIDGPRTIVLVNGVKVTDHKEGDPMVHLKIDNLGRFYKRENEGYIGLQNDGEKDQIFFKEIAVKPLKK